MNEPDIPQWQGLERLFDALQTHEALDLETVTGIKPAGVRRSELDRINEVTMGMYIDPYVRWQVGQLSVGDQHREAPGRWR
ncbi:MAG: hypothetical protein CME36_09960 [unclassified Hahellaceae]|nr:hypothetical protein [Hahellaceae bacterium]